MIVQSWQGLVYQEDRIVDLESNILAFAETSKVLVGISESRHGLNLFMIYNAYGVPMKEFRMSDKYKLSPSSKGDDGEILYNKLIACSHNTDFESDCVFSSSNILDENKMLIFNPKDSLERSTFPEVTEIKIHSSAEIYEHFDWIADTNYFLAAPYRNSFNKKNLLDRYSRFGEYSDTHLSSNLVVTIYSILMVNETRHCLLSDSSTIHQVDITRKEQSPRSGVAFKKLQMLTLMERDFSMNLVIAYQSVNSIIQVFSYDYFIGYIDQEVTRLQSLAVIGQSNFVVTKSDKSIGFYEFQSSSMSLFLISDDRIDRKGPLYYSKILTSIISNSGSGSLNYLRLINLPLDSDANCHPVCRSCSIAFTKNGCTKCMREEQTSFSFCSDDPFNSQTKLYGYTSNYDFSNPSSSSFGSILIYMAVICGICSILIICIFVLWCILSEAPKKNSDRTRNQSAIRPQQNSNYSSNNMSHSPISHPVQPLIPPSYNANQYPASTQIQQPPMRYTQQQPSQFSSQIPLMPRSPYAGPQQNSGFGVPYQNQGPVPSPQFQIPVNPQPFMMGGLQQQQNFMPAPPMMINVPQQHVVEGISANNPGDELEIKEINVDRAKTQKQF